MHVLHLLLLFLSAGPAAANWPLFRGDPLQSGCLSSADFPDKPELLWKINLPDGIESTAAIVDNTAYIGTLDGQVFALSLRDGSTIWKYHTKAITLRASPAVCGGLVIIGDGDSQGTIHALDAKTGALKWKFPTQGEIVSSANVTPKGRLLVGSNDGNLYCLDAKNGALLWKYGIDQPINGAPAFIDGHTFIAGCDANVHIVKTDDGSLVGKVPLGAPAGASAALRDALLFVGNMDRSFLCIDWKKQAVVWEHEPERAAPFYSSPAIAGEIVVVGSRDRKIHALAAADGKPLWTFPTRGRVDSSPIVLANRVWCPSGDGNLYCLDLKSGNKLWQHALGSAVTASCAYGQGRLVIGTSDGVVFCFGAR
jgi:outer membrane protein assembly factor BamB